MTTPARSVKRGHGTKERPIVKELWEREAYAPRSLALKEGSDFLPNNRNVDYARYFDPKFAAEELEAVWKKCWLYACREEDIPNVGDRVPLHVGPLSFFIVRTTATEFKAFLNSCLHRGTMLCAKPASGASIRCPFHGWEWNIDGKLKKIPGHWDFPEITRVNGSLPEVKLERWGGGIFINADAKAPPLAEALGPLPKHFEKFQLERRYTAARFRKEIHANWKIVQEAFMEAYHLGTTHPEAAPFNSDVQAQYDIWPGKPWPVARNASCAANPAVDAPPEATAYTAGQMYATAMKEWHFRDAELPVLDPSQDIRTQLGRWHRQQFESTYGRPTESADAELMDSLLYYVFPHSTFWLCEAVPFTYQFTPHPTDCEKSFFEVRLMRPQPQGGPIPPSAPVVELGPNDSVFTNVPAFGFLGFVFDQDMSNLPLVQRGLHAADPKRFHTRLGAYQEMIIQQWHATIDEHIAAYKAENT
ncbi:MAG TPA: aromatic ring-hydroxylating dioxygenase subunit alpha [Steroidobacteraceae bacterium]|nr:aromatic ring-hydroxylating dioxygenase subunit alpha [Steroidobacteraceae bacterium]